MAKAKLVIITGLSGAGRTVAIHTLEDFGFYCIDNLPFGLLESVANFLARSSHPFFALGMDVRDADFAARFPETKKLLSQLLDVEIVFLKADDDTILNRYVSSRRRHPLFDQAGELLLAIKRERALLESIENLADVVIETTATSPHELARQLEQQFSREGLRRRLHITVTSFGFKFGLLRSADSIFDVRFLLNPYFVPDLRDKTGFDKSVRDHVFSDPHFPDFFQKILDLNLSIIPHYFNEGKHYFRIGIGCTGGKHRSVAIAEALAEKLSLANLDHVTVSVSHRDVHEFNPLG